MASLAGDLSQVVNANATIQPQNGTGAIAGTAVPTTYCDGDIMTMRCFVGTVNTLTTINFTAECSADGTTWVAAKGIGGINANTSITAANTASSFGFFPGNGAVSQYVRANIPTFTATAANVTAIVEWQTRIGSDAGFQSTPPSGST